MFLKQKTEIIFSVFFGDFKSHTGNSVRICCFIHRKKIMSTMERCITRKEVFIQVISSIPRSGLYNVNLNLTYKALKRQYKNQQTSLIHYPIKMFQKHFRTLRVCFPECSSSHKIIYLNYHLMQGFGDGFYKTKLQKIVFFGTGTDHSTHTCGAQCNFSFSFPYTDIWLTLLCICTIMYVFPHTCKSRYFLHSFYLLC